MTWRQRFADWIAPKAARAVQEAETAVGDAKEKVVVIAQQKTGMPRRAVLFLMTLILLSLSVGGYAVYWRFFRPVKPPVAQVPVQTIGGGTVYQGNQVPAMARAIKAGKPKPTTTVRPVAATPVDELPTEEQAKAPVVPPAAGPDNVVRKLQVLDTQVVPPSRGEVYTRAYIYPDGSTKILQDPQQEKFWGLPWKDGNWKRLEIEGGPGSGGKKWDIGPAWFPLRIGSVQIGTRVETWGQEDGSLKWAASLRFRVEPFRDLYR